MAIKPILFNTDMVRAILDGRKTVTRRVVKVPPYYPHFYKLHDNADGALTAARDGLYAGFYNDEQIFYIDGEKHIDAVYYKAPYKPGQILYVRETFAQVAKHIYWYRADNAEYAKNILWKPSIHMPKEAARIWLRVTDVRVERLQDITPEDCIREGVEAEALKEVGGEFVRGMLNDIWDSTIKKSDLDRYGWDANPWVYVIEFERIKKDETM